MLDIAVNFNNGVLAFCESAANHGHVVLQMLQERELFVGVAV